MIHLTPQTLARARAGQEAAVAAVLTHMMPLLRRAAALRRRGCGCRHLLAAGEGPARYLWYGLRQAGYWRKMPRRR